MSGVLITLRKTNMRNGIGAALAVAALRALALPGTFETSTWATSAFVMAAKSPLKTGNFRKRSPSTSLLSLATDPLKIAEATATTTSPVNDSDRTKRNRGALRILFLSSDTGGKARC